MSLSTYWFNSNTRLPKETTESLHRKARTDIPEYLSTPGNYVCRQVLQMKTDTHQLLEGCRHFEKAYYCVLELSQSPFG